MRISGGFTGAGIVAGVCGWPIKHSRSPHLHNYWLRQYEIDGVYVPFAMPPEGVKDAIRMLPALGISGMNVTVPNKEKAYKAMDEVDRWAQRLKAVNTIVVRDGVLRGVNTDAFGFLESLLDAKPDWRADAGPVVVLGAGGAARAIVAGLQDKGAPEIRIANRTSERAAAISDEFGDPVRPILWEHRSRALSDAALLVNTTSLGMEGHPALEIDLAKLPNASVVYDIVYVPLETPLLAAARLRGNLAIDGLGMLLHQARPGFREWFGVDPVVDQALRDHVLAAL